MSYSNINNVKMVDGNLVDKILEQGQKLRNAMVGSILKNDPFNAEIIYNKHFNTPCTISKSNSEVYNENNVENLPLNEKRLETFIKGEFMTKEDEKIALDTLRSLSASELVRTTERSLKSNHINSCRCFTCETYNSEYLKCDLRNDTAPVHNHHTKNNLFEEIQERYSNENQHLLKSVDSLRISISSLILNETGYQKISTYDRNVPSNSTNVFLEYQIPAKLIINSKKSKVDSGLTTNCIRLCSKITNDTITFKHVEVHSLKNLIRINLEICEIEFKISYRNSSKKNSNILGYATFNLQELLMTKNLTCNRGLNIFLNKNIPISVGILKVSVQLGCGRYFGQEFVDAIYSSQKDNIVLDSDDSANQLFYQKNNVRTSANEATKKIDFLQLKISKPQNEKSNLTFKKLENSTTPSDSYSNIHPEVSDNVGVLPNLASNSSYFVKENQNKNISLDVKETEKQVLFGFFYIAEALYLSDPISTYFTCQLFCQYETSKSNLITSTSNPTFNFCQVVPLVLDNDLLLRWRENFIVIEFWQKTVSGDRVLGLTNIPLHQFYLGYRNPVIIKHFAKNKLPIIGTDWWEPINTIDNEHIGQVQILIALGTEEQINNLKSERGFSDNCVKAKFLLPKDKPKIEVVRKKSSKSTPRIVNKQITKFKQKQHCSVQTVENLSPKITKIVDNVKKFDVATQSDLEMDSKEKEGKQKKTEDKTNSTQEMLGSFLNQLMAQRRSNVFVENSTNTDTNMVEQIDIENSNLQTAQHKTNVELKKTTDLLESLQKALSTDILQKTQSSNNKIGCFKANIVILSANHLPSRKKCRSKKSRNRSLKNEENILPSCYVTFETLPNEGLKITPIIMKNTSPAWNFKSDVNLPIDLLQNSQKRLIFKVWRKSNSTVMTHNMQADTVLGFAAVDLTILLSNFPNIQGWYNIVDFSGKCNGQINIHITPLENLKVYQIKKDNYNHETNSVPKAALETDSLSIEPSETLSRALKRKFIELDEITQRLRLRLSKVTEEDSESSNDGVAEEFERDINTLSIEEDFDLINFEENATTIKEIESRTNLQQSLLKTEEHEDAILNENVNKRSNKGSSTLESVSEVSSSINTKVEIGGAESVCSLDQQLQAGKQHISFLLEKLSLLSAEVTNPFQNRYVSGCSIINDPNVVDNIDTEALLQELDHSSRPNIQSSVPFSQEEFDEIYSSSVENSKIDTATTFNSDTSLITNFSDRRLAPEGQGNTSEEKIIKND